MAYVAIKGGGKAIAESAAIMEFFRTAQGGEGSPLTPADIEHQLRFIHSRIISEGGLYHPRLAALALKQSVGDPLEASFILRAYRSTKPRLESQTDADTGRMRLIRRISSTFKDIPGGQMLGGTPDYSLRLFRFGLAEEDPTHFRNFARQWLGSLPEEELPETFPKVQDALRAEGLLPPLDRNRTSVPFDITREAMVFPLPRSANLAVMARGETGGMLCLAYSSMRGYGSIHPTIGELRVGYLPVEVPHPVTGEPIEAGEILVTECEVITMYEKEDEDALPRFTIGYGACFGHNEVKAIAMAILDRSLQKGRARGRAEAPAEDQEFVLLHIDGIESMGFTTHYKLPHYVTFQSDLDRLRATQQKATQERDHG
jgi:alpha-D-ribose 1-methylphosphonate 5-triphosphate synthase subunit PhnI